MDHLEVETVQETEQKNEKPYTLRPLCDEDLYPILAIIGKVFPDELSTAFVQVASKEKTFKEIGYDVGFKLFTAVIKNLHTVDVEVYEMLSSLSGIPAQDIRKMKFGTTPKMLWEVYNDVKNQDFFGDASKSS
jgi:hypothetical protein